MLPNSCLNILLTRCHVLFRPLSPTFGQAFPSILRLVLVTTCLIGPLKDGHQSGSAFGPDIYVAYSINSHPNWDETLLLIEPFPRGNSAMNMV